MTGRATLPRVDRARGLLLAGLFMLALLPGCRYVPRHVEGLDAPDITMLPLRAWLHNEGVRVRAVSGCFARDCAKVAVGVIEARGEDAATLERLLRDPRPLERHLRESDTADTGKVRAAIRTLVSTQPARAGAAEGFLMVMRDDRGERPPAVILAVGRRRGDVLDLALVVGSDADAVRTIGETVVRANFQER